jgi:SNF2 family DNA or RNA helicase
LRIPEFQTVQYRLSLSTSERLEYTKVSEQYKAAIDDAICGRQTASAYRSILQAILSFRLVCNHGMIRSQSTSSKHQEKIEIQALMQEASLFCVYCDAEIRLDGSEDDFPAAMLSPCSHLVCYSCHKTYIEDLKRVTKGFEVRCLNCSTALNTDGTTFKKRTMEDTEQDEPHTVSTKFAKLVQDIKIHQGTDKWYVLSLFVSNILFTSSSIVFSVWKRTLNVFASILMDHGIQFVQLDGSLKLSDRHKVLEQFKQDKTTPVLLMTLGTGAVG